MKSLLVVGDVMLDRYWKGVSTRLSPEAPVPVVKVGSIESRLGGAANVALNLKSIVSSNSSVTLCGLIGNDLAGNEVRQRIMDSEIVDSLVLGRQPTIEKVRVIAQNQQIVRADFEQNFDDDSLHLIV